jgi:hypothetical protein
MYLIYKGLCSDGSNNYLTHEDGEIQCNTVEEGKKYLLDNGVLQENLNQYGFEEL